MKKVINYESLRFDWITAITLVVCALAIAAMFFPIFSAAETLEPVFITVIRWWNLPEFSGWGGITISLPFLFLALLFSRMDNTTKTVCWFVLNFLGTYAISASCIAAKLWMSEHVGLHISRGSSIALFIPMLIAASILTFLKIRRSGKKEE